MKILICLLLMTSLCFADNFQIHKDRRIKKFIFIKASKRIDLIGHLPFEINSEGHKFSIKDLPKGDVYCGQGIWIFKYQFNEGYMPTKCELK